MEHDQAELNSLRMEADKNDRMFKSLYESLVSGLITADEYREMRESYETKMQESLARAVELENRQTKFDKQIAEYYELSDLITNAESNGITEKIIDCLIDKILIFSDRHIDVDFLFDKGFDIISEVASGE